MLSDSRICWPNRTTCSSTPNPAYRLPGSQGIKKAPLLVAQLGGFSWSILGEGKLPLGSSEVPSYRLGTLP
jgi:hypothetical protein